MEYCRQVDIVVPVYNAYSSLIKCVDSVLSNTDFSSARLVLVEDKSTDGRIIPYLREISQQHKQIVVLENEKNLGFVRTVNRALEQAQGDVVLLDSDTIVCPGWLSRMQKAAMSSPRVGTVTPLSNNASHCTIPMFECQGDSLEQTITRTQSCVRTFSLHSYPDIGVGVRFCMYIRQETLRDVGLLDTENFGGGCGEEVDFCLKAEQMGYQNILCDDVFIYHEGTASFSLKTESKNTIADVRLFREKYAQQFPHVLQIAGEVEQTEWYKNFEICRRFSNNRKNILYLVQADFREDASNNVGGTQFHVKDLTMGLKNNYNIFVMARDRDYLRLTIYIDEERMSFKFHIGNATQFPVFHDRSQYELYLDILKAFRIDVVHIHHTYSLTLDLYYAAKELSIPLMATLHDFYTVCPTIFLLENRTDYCGDKGCNTNCSGCLELCRGISAKLDYISKWREEHLSALKLCDEIFTPSESAKKIVLQYYPDLDDKIRVITHGINIVSQDYEQDGTPVESDKLRFFIGSSEADLEKGKICGWAYLDGCSSTDSKGYLILSSEGKKDIKIPLSLVFRGDVTEIDPRYGNSGFSLVYPLNVLEKGQWSVRIAIRNGNEYVCSKPCCILKGTAKTEKGFNIAFIGGMCAEKGSQNIYKMIKQGSRDINWFIFGGIGDRELEMLEQPNLFKTSWYRREDLEHLFEMYQIDMVCILPILAETYCYTLSEAIACNRPVLVADIGALGERMHQMNCGWTIPVNATTKERLDRIEEIRCNPQMLAEAKERVSRYHHRTIPDMVADYAAVYEKCPVHTGEKVAPQKQESLYQGYLLGELNWGDGNTLAMQKRISSLENQLAMIENSGGYKAILALRRMKFPFKNTLKRIVFCCYRIAQKMHIA